MKKIVALVLACALLLVFAVSQAETAASGQYQTVTPEEIKAGLDAGEPFLIVDVRTAEEYEEGHIPGAIHIPNETIGSAQPEEIPDLDTPVVVYCRSGRRSKEAANKLLSMGYTSVRDLGGIQSWPYETVTGSEPGAWTPDAAQTRGILSRFHTTDLDGNAVDQSILSDYNVTMVNIWATYCGPCLREMPDLGELAAEYKDRGVQIVGLVSDVLDYDGSLSESQIQTAKDIVEATHADYPHILPSEDLYGILYQTTSVPTTFFVDRAGRQVGYAYVGSMDKAAWASIIEEMLAEVSQ